MVTMTISPSIEQMFKDSLINKDTTWTNTKINNMKTLHNIYEEHKKVCGYDEDILAERTFLAIIDSEIERHTKYITEYLHIKFIRTDSNEENTERDEFNKEVTMYLNMRAEDSITYLQEQRKLIEEKI